MSTEDKKSGIDPQSAPSSEGTNVDWGEDLIARTAMFPGGAEPAAPPRPDATRVLDAAKLGETLESASILVREGLFGEAKKILRKILRADPSSTSAARLLTEIQDAEIAKLLQAEAPKPKAEARRAAFAAPAARTIESRLLRDLGIEEPPSGEEEHAAFLQEIEAGLRGSSGGDRLALAIGLKEIGLRAEAMRILKPLQAEEDPALRAAAASVSAECAIGLGDLLRAEMRLRDALCDVDLPSHARATLHYSLAETYEAMGRGPAALLHYRASEQFSPDHRDVRRRIRQLGGEG